MHLSIVLPSNRSSISTYARIFDACACGNDQVEVIVRDNSGSQEKKDILSSISGINCRLVFTPPCGGRENCFEALALAQGDFVFFMADDDICTRAAINAVSRAIQEHSSDSTIIGITGNYLVEDSFQSQLLSYPPLDMPSAAKRLDSYLGLSGANLLHYSAIRRSVMERTVQYSNSLPYWFSYHDQIMALVYAAAGRFVSTNRLIYQYDSSKWDTWDRALESDLVYYTSNGLDGSILRLHWLLCAFEGAKTIMGKFPGLALSAEERQTVATRWFEAMYIRFRHGASGMTRTAPGCRFDAEAQAFCRKWAQATNFNLNELCQDIAGHIALSSREGAERYVGFWAN